MMIVTQGYGEEDKDLIIADIEVSVEVDGIINVEVVVE